MHPSYDFQGAVLWLFNPGAIFVQGVALPVDDGYRPADRDPSKS